MDIYARNLKFMTIGLDYMNLLFQFNRYMLKHVYREVNYVADTMVRIVVYQQSKFVMHYLS